MATAIVSPTTIARAAEALNRLAGLSPAARRVGAELLSHTNKGSGTAWPGERRMAEALGYDRRTIGRAKKELAAAGVLSWRRRGRRTALYHLAFDRLVDLGRRIARRVREATTRRMAGKGDVRIHQHRPQQDHQRRGRYQVLNGTSSSPNISQPRFKDGGEGRRAPVTAMRADIPDEILDRRAHQRLWDAIRGVGAELMTAVMLHEKAAELELEAVRAERFRPGSGLALLVEGLKGVRR